MNKLSRQVINPSLPSKFAKLADVVDDSAKLSFWDYISGSFDSLTKENNNKISPKGKGQWGFQTNKLPEKTSRLKHPQETVQLKATVKQIQLQENKELSKVLQTCNTEGIKSVFTKRLIFFKVGQ